MKTTILSFAVLLAAALTSVAADLPWIYDVSRRVEPTPSAVTSTQGCSLDAIPRASACGVADRLCAICWDEELSPGCNLTTLPLGLFIYFR